MAGDPAAAEWFRRAAAPGATSWEQGDGREAWGRPIGALKASLLAGDDDGGRGTRAGRSSSALRRRIADRPLRRCARAARARSLGRGATRSPSRCAGRDDFPHDVADALASIAAHDGDGYGEAVESVVASFESREEYLEDVAVADTALVLDGARAPARHRRAAAGLADASALRLVVGSPSRSSGGTRP